MEVALIKKCWAALTARRMIRDGTAGIYMLQHKSYRSIDRLGCQRHTCGAASAAELATSLRPGSGQNEVCLRNMAT